VKVGCVEAFDEPFLPFMPEAGVGEAAREGLLLPTLRARYIAKVDQERDGALGTRLVALRDQRLDLPPRRLAAALSD